MAKKNNVDYFHGFIDQADCACRAADMLLDVMTNFDSDKIGESMKAIHAIEHEADGVKHTYMTALAKEFITPIEREDIISLCQTLDDIVDSVEDVLIHIYINDIRVMRPDAIEFAKIVRSCCVSVRDLMREFHGFRKIDLSSRVIAINGLEEDGDKLYVTAMRRLHTTDCTPVTIMGWRKIYDYLEACCDNCEHVSDAAESIILKNT